MDIDQRRLLLISIVVSLQILQAEVFQHAAVRRSFLFELLESANTGHYRQAVVRQRNIFVSSNNKTWQYEYMTNHWQAFCIWTLESARCYFSLTRSLFIISMSLQQLYLSVKHQRAERVLQIPIVHHWTAALGRAEAIQKVVALTNYDFYLIQKPEGM